MLSIRMKRLGRKGHPTYRVVVQDSRQSPSSGKYVALLGSYDPHTKQSSLVKDKAEFYLKNGAQPSDRVAALFKTEKITLPKWVEKPTKKEKQLKNPDKLRRNRPADSTPADKPEDVEKSEDIVPAEEVSKDGASEEPPKPEQEAAGDQAEKAESETEKQEASTDEAKPESNADESSNGDKS